MSVLCDRNILFDDGGKTLQDCYASSFVIWYGILDHKERLFTKDKYSRDGHASLNTRYKDTTCQDMQSLHLREDEREQPTVV